MAAVRVNPARTRALGVLVLLCFLVPGIFGHDPWKQDEGYTFGIVLETLQTGQWVVPTLAGEPFMEKPPLFYLTAAASARALSAWLPLHDGARAATLLYIGLGLLCVALIARKVFGPGHGTLAALLVAGCLGFPLHSHEMISDAALFAGFGIALLGLAHALDRPLLAGALLGTGVGVGFMSKGLVEPSMVGLAMLLLPVACREWRAASYAKAAAWALLFAMPWLTVWPVLLYLQNPHEFFTWFWINNFGRYFGFAHLGADTEPWYYTRTLPWFTLPAAPLALFALTNKGLIGTQEKAGVQAMVASAVAMCAVLSTAATARALYALPLLIPLAILASRGAMALPRPAGIWTTRIAATICGAVALALAGMWAYGIAFGHAPALRVVTDRLAADYPFPVVTGFVAMATVVVATWIVVLRDRHATPVHRWTASIALVWGILATLLLPWLDNARSFRDPFTSIARLVGADDCLVSVGLGENQRGMLHYLAGIRAEHDLSSADECSYALWQRNHAGELAPEILRRWTLVWQGARPAESDERFFLFRMPAIRLTSGDGRRTARQSNPR